MEDDVVHGFQASNKEDNEGEIARPCLAGAAFGPSRGNEEVLRPELVDGERGRDGKLFLFILAYPSHQACPLKLDFLTIDAK